MKKKAIHNTTNHSHTPPPSNFTETKNMAESDQSAVVDRPDRTTTEVFQRNSGQTSDSNGISVCISRVFKNINWRRIRRHIIEANLGYVERVDVIPIFRQNEETGERVLAFKRAFVHFKKGSWNMESEQAREALEKLRKGESLKIIYEDPWFWNVSISMSPRPEGPPRRNNITTTSPQQHTVRVATE